MGVEQGEADLRVVLARHQRPQLALQRARARVVAGIGHQQHVVGPAEGPAAPRRPGVVDLQHQVAMALLELLHLVGEA